MRTVKNSAVYSDFKRWYYTFCICVFTVIFGMVFAIKGCVNYNTDVSNSSSAIGSQINFGRSNATLTIKDIYTDEAHSVLIARIGGSASELSKLPYKGTDYDVILQNDNVQSQDGTTPVLFGRMGTDGDMFLVIPNPQNSVYTVGIINRNFINTTNNSNNSNNNNVTNLTNPTTQSMSKLLSTYQTNRNKDNNNDNAVVQSDAYDTAFFRLSVNPAIDSDAYKPEVLPGTLLKDGQFDFEGFFNKVFKNNSLDTLNKEYQSLSRNREQIQKSMKEYQERLNVNSNDDDARQALNAQQKNLDDVNRKIEDTGAEITNYTNLTYSQDLFTNLQTRAYLLKSTK